MESLSLSFNAVAPIFLVMLLGYVVKCLKMAEKTHFDTMNKLVFKLFLPVLLFKNIYESGSIEIFDFKMMAFTIIAVLIVFFMGYGAVFLLTKDNSKRGVMLQGFFRSNYAILGVPLVSFLCKGNEIGLSSVMVATVVPVFNVLAVVALEKFNGGNVSVKKMLLGIVKNPLIIGCVCGLIFVLTGLKLPSFVEKSVKDVASIASPLAIFVLGASFTFTSVKGYLREIIQVVSTRLVIVPLITLIPAILLGFRGEALACLLVVFGTPVAVSSFAMAQQMGGDETLAGHLVVVSSSLCLLTLFLWIFALSSFGFV